MTSFHVLLTKSPQLIKYNKKLLFPLNIAQNETFFIKFLQHFSLIKMLNASLQTIELNLSNNNWKV